MTDDKALELYEQCDRELPDRGDLGSFKRLIGAFARALLAAPPAAELAPVAIDLAARMEHAEGVLRALPKLEPTISIANLLAEYGVDDREELWESIQAIADIRARQAIFAAPTPSMPAAAMAPVATKRTKLQPIGNELYEHYVSMSAQTHEALIKEYARACIATPTPSTPAPSQVELDARVELEVKAGLWDEVRIICVPHGAGVDKPITEWLEERLAIHAPSTPAPKNCQTGWADFCKASQHDGVACPADSCDIDDGVRKDHALSTPAPVAMTDAQIVEIYDEFYTQEDDRESGHILPFARALLAATPLTRPDVSDMLSPDEIEDFARAADDFTECGETSTDYSKLMDWARRGFLECTHFDVMPKGRSAVAAARALLASPTTPQSKDPV